MRNPPVRVNKPAENILTSKRFAAMRQTQNDIARIVNLFDISGAKVQKKAASDWDAADFMKCKLNYSAYSAMMLLTCSGTRRP